MNIVIFLWRRTRQRYKWCIEIAEYWTVHNALCIMMCSGNCQFALGVDLFIYTWPLYCGRWNSLRMSWSFQLRNWQLEE